MTVRWAVKCRSNNRLDGYRESYHFKLGYPMLFLNRQDARDYIKREYSYLKHRPDLRAEPHGWLMPIAERVEVILRPYQMSAKVKRCIITHI